jgi:RNA recognition motif-containing protein
MDIYVGNMNYASTAESLRTLFETHGTVESVKLITDRETGRPRGFAFVQMPNDEEARAAIAATDGQQFDGRTLKVNQAQGREKRGPIGGPRPPRGASW